ncbi:hypothetical protein IV203_006174 [Nitzschia inconspicua]|uniref:EGF-like domain-containing protein n=1 Tax=Nitzschia inconspicua TaxID=303405 RepID=A0A9K3KNP7_9STRA|nr:hypothetical protein IV203_030470 [Nitzschia inconspicua]KAG7347105.1 hypothetical protein IV203_006174 [Nitzschia inconspicua]
MRHLIGSSLYLLMLLVGVTGGEVEIGSEDNRRQTAKNEFWNFASCEMKCANGGYCSLVEGTADELARMAQSGKLISTCICKPGFSGVTCQHVDQRCSLPERKCSNGFPCQVVNTDKNGTIEWSCDCAMADSLSDFAGKMCREPLTEYCNGKFDPHAPFAFCTNGGRCRGDFMGAQVDPGNTMVNAFYQDAGCICPRDFYGPHCEFLKLNVIDDLENSLAEEIRTPPPTNQPSQTRKHLAPVLTSIFVLLSASLLITAVMLHFREERIPTVRRVQFWGTEDNVSVMWMSTVHHGQYLGNIQFLDEGIITEQDLATVFEDVELT